MKKLFEEKITTNYKVLKKITNRKEEK